MIANDGSGNIPERDEWETPQWLFDILNKQYHFKFDCCATNNNCKTVYMCNEFEKRESIPEGYVCWMNPPFSKAKKMFEHFFDIVKNGVAIYRCDNFETELWQKTIFPNVDWVFIPDKRIVYDGLTGSGARFPSALIGIGIEAPKDLKGICLKQKG